MKILRSNIFSTVSCHLWHLDSKSDRSKCIDIVLSIEVVSHKWKKKKIISHEKLITDTKYCNWFILYEDGGLPEKPRWVYSESTSSLHIIVSIVRTNYIQMYPISLSFVSWLAYIIYKQLQIYRIFCDFQSLQITLSKCIIR